MFDIRAVVFITIWVFSGGYIEDVKTTKCIPCVDHRTLPATPAGSVGERWIDTLDRKFISDRIDIVTGIS
jgi:hypothetical protein